ncbi:MAG TPA: replication-associated recombination protein A [Symbiobacteriaceae bacterium]|nr:replication-associated recombination protein A [Symbiobacteriaceae bacterium]
MHDQPEEVVSVDLFEYARQQQMASQAPLAARMRAQTLEEYVGQEHILGPGKFLRKALEAGKVPSCILFGPPGTGKTTLARIMASKMDAHFEQLNAVTSGVPDIRRIVDEAKTRMGQYGRRTIVFIDEIHRWRKDQQDALLPHVEEGLITLIGATTQNPLVSVNAPLVSRTRIFELQSLTDRHIRQLLERALELPGRGLGNYNAALAHDAAEHLIRTSGGDARTALNALELAVVLADPDENGRRTVTLPIAEEALLKRAVVYDQDGDEHYHVASALIKSIRGSDADAAVYWLARMIYAGEDPRFVARRLVISAAEDIGLADPTALPLAQAAADAVSFIGMPEGRIMLAEVAIYLACAPKSNTAYLAIDKALAMVGREKTPPVPNHLKDGGYGSGERLGYGKGYQYPHDFAAGWVQQRYLPDGVEGPFWEPGTRGREEVLARVLRERRAIGASGNPK